MPSTIFALSTGAGKSAVAVIRISGPEAKYVLTSIAGSLPSPRRASLRAIKHPHTGDLIDKGLVIYFPGPQSFTGEDCAELHLHGGRAVIEGAMEALSGFQDLSLAEPGEFTRRAYHNHRLDLLEVEGLADLIDAETEAQRKQAVRQLSGELSSLYESWRAQLIKAMALFEAGIDFVDEEDVPKSLLSPVREELSSLEESLSGHLDDNRRGERLRDGLKLVIIGEPNVGKSSLMNLLSQRKAAIVSDLAGTTRDVIETHLDIGGYPVILTDTAGLRQTDEKIEQVGVELALEEAAKADLLVILEEPGRDESSASPLLHEEIIDSGAIRVLNKVDLLTSGEKKARSGIDCALSAKTGEGVEGLLELITQKAKVLSDTSEAPGLTRARHRHALSKTLHHIQEALAKLGKEEEELVAEDMRQAAHFLGSITGHVGVEDLLDVIFAQFCIGK